MRGELSDEEYSEGKKGSHDAAVMVETANGKDAIRFTTSMELGGGRDQTRGRGWTSS